MMEAPKLTEIWLNNVQGYRELRVDFDNDRHHAMMIEPPYDKEAVARAFEQIAANIRRDWKLVPNAALTGPDGSAATGRSG